MLVKTIFTIKEKNQRPFHVEVEAVGQEAATAVLNRYTNAAVILVGFSVDGKVIYPTL